MKKLIMALLVAACTSTSPTAHHTTTPKPTPAPQGDVQKGLASWYGESQMTASGEKFNKNAMTAAHRSLPFGTIVRITNQKNGRSVNVRINDRGPYGGGRIIDVSEAAARQLQMIDAGVVPCTLEVVSRPK
jgi:rare lipoprotein A